MRSPSSFSYRFRIVRSSCPFHLTKEIDWFGKRAVIQVQKNTWHPSKSDIEGTDGLVRATNGGNFNMIIPDESNPSAPCTLFSLRWMATKNAYLVDTRKKCPASFNQYLTSMVEGYEKYFKRT